MKTKQMCYLNKYIKLVSSARYYFYEVNLYILLDIKQYFSKVDKHDKWYYYNSLHLNIYIYLFINLFV